ncbi:ABC transporter permease [Mycolicibacterium parafortuitum]|uniref:ABC transporter membrane protein [Nocardia brasiliensis ATCC] n=1 Tax=Mycolicibacterium parafortuitum TaxID=39692 RepID=A0A375YMK1_MYCPF|nr:ABC transporter permease [Mycolicibacterium parafortuitum]ORB29794.1 antibiotic transporter [Mycolicibacterium parafortuitum]SRX82375.1 ABC transporter membrane protein [Nocardia brasiliensis ATCC] [Mycolicibacterium parafortuitum]
MTDQLAATAPPRSVAIPHAARPPVSTIQQWWVLTVRMIIPTLRNGELATQIVGSVVFTIGYYLPLKQMMGAVQPLSSYAQYLTPLIVLQAVWFAAISAAFRSATDSVDGINRRFRAMPIPAVMPLASRMTASMYRCCVALAVSIGCGHVIGFRFDNGVFGILGFVGLALLIGAALAIIGDLIGVATQNPEATAPMMLIPQLTLGLASVGLQPAERFPDWIQGFVRNQPLSQWVYGLQAFAGDSTGNAPEATWSVLGPALAWAVVCIVVALALHIWVTRRRNS